jgi:hypothetical protein
VIAVRADHRALLALTAAVLAAHWWLLQSTPARFGASATQPLKALVTRTIVLAPANAEVESNVAPVAAPVAAPVPVARSPRPQLSAQPTAPVALQPTSPAPEEAIAAAAPPAPIAAPAPPPPMPAPTPAPTRDAAVALSIPGSARLRYKVEAQARRQYWQATSTLDWRHDGSNYEASMEVGALFVGSRAQRSVGKITAEGLAPLRFSDKSRSEEAAHFQRDQGKVSFSSNRPDAVLMAGAQDRLSVLLQLAAMFGGDPKKFPAGATITIQTASTREAEAWQFTVEGEEQLQLPGGSMAAIKLTRNPRKEFDQKVELWLAPGMDYVPVRLRLTQPNGDWVDQQWSSTDRG